MRDGLTVRYKLKKSFVVLLEMSKKEKIWRSLVEKLRTEIFQFRGFIGRVKVTAFKGYEPPASIRLPKNKNFRKDICNSIFYEF